MVTLRQLKEQKERLLKERARAQDKQNILSQKIELEKEINILKRSPSKIRNIEFAKRTGKGLKILGAKIGSATIRQAKRIKEQQLRDQAALRKSSKKSKKLKTGQKLSKIKEKKGFDVFSNLDF